MLPKCTGAVLLVALARMAGVAQTPKPYLDVQVYDATAPAGGAVQVMVVLTDPKPITSGYMQFELSNDFDLYGVALFSDAGDVSGVAQRRGGHVGVRFTSPSGSYGLSTAYLPIMILTLRVPEQGGSTQVPLRLDESSFWRDPSGKPYPKQVKHGLFTLGGSVSITEVEPERGSVKAGEVLEVEGIGFRPGAAVEMEGVPLSSVRVVNSRLIEATIEADSSLDRRELRVTNPDRSAAEYYLYRRHEAYGRIKEGPLASVYPVFARQTYTDALYGPLPKPAALALLSPEASATATVEVFSPTMVRRGAGTITLPQGKYVLRKISDIVEDGLVCAGGYVRVSSPQPLHMLLMIPEGETGPVTPVDALRAN